MFLKTYNTKPSLEGKNGPYIHCYFKNRADLGYFMQPATRWQAFLPLGSPVFDPHWSNKKTNKTTTATNKKCAGSRGHEALLVMGTQRQKSGQQQPVAMHVNERCSVASGSLMKHVRMATALCSAVGHLHIMMYGGLRCIASSALVKCQSSNSESRGHEALLTNEASKLQLPLHQSGETTAAKGRSLERERRAGAALRPMFFCEFVFKNEIFVTQSRNAASVFKCGSKLSTVKGCEPPPQWNTLIALVAVSLLRGSPQLRILFDVTFYFLCPLSFSQVASVPFVSVSLSYGGAQSLSAGATLCV